VVNDCQGKEEEPGQRIQGTAAAATAVAAACVVQKASSRSDAEQQGRHQHVEVGIESV